MCTAGDSEGEKETVFTDLTEAPRERGEKLQIMIFVARLYQVAVDLNLNCNPNFREALYSQSLIQIKL